MSLFKSSQNIKYKVKFNVTMIEMEIIYHKCEETYRELDEAIVLGHEMILSENPNCISKHRMGFGYLTDFLILPPGKVIESTSSSDNKSSIDIGDLPPRPPLPKKLLDILTSIKITHLEWIKAYYIPHYT